MLHEFINPIYRKPTNREMAAVSPSEQVLSQYSRFLNSSNKGIFRMIADFGCAANDKVINARKECLIYSLPGGGNSFSFRAEKHRVRHLADITLAGEKLVITGVFMHGFIADVGNVPIDSISLNSPAMKFVVGFKPSISEDNLLVVDEKLSRGVEQDGFRYAKEVDVSLGSTYVFRAVAYRGKVMRSARGVAYNELNYDKRRDVTVAFQVVERGADGSVTIVWKQLADLESPKIKMPKATKQTAEESNE
jgi:hypothetical protein